MLKTSYWYRFHPLYLSFSPGCDLNTRECFDGPAAPQQGMLGALIVWWPASFWLQWTMADGTVHTGSPAKFSTKPTEEWKQTRKMYAIKQIKICAEYRDMLPRPRLDLSGTPGLRPIGLSPGSWQTSLGLGSMSRYSAQILICITGPLLPFYQLNLQYGRTNVIHTKAQNISTDWQSVSYTLIRFSLTSYTNSKAMTSEWVSERSLTAFLRQLTPWSM